MTRLLTAALFTLLCANFSWASDEAILADYIPQGRITRFEGPITIWMGGKGRLEGQYYLEAVMNELRGIIPHVPINQTSSLRDAGIRVYLTKSNEEWEETVRKTKVDQAGWRERGHFVRGLTRIETTPHGQILKADVVLHLDFQTSGGQKLWIVRHELMHALGILGHPRTPDTVLNSNQLQHDKNSLFSDSDILVLKTLYRDDLRAGDPW